MSSILKSFISKVSITMASVQDLAEYWEEGKPVLPPFEIAQQAVVAEQWVVALDSVTYNIGASVSLMMTPHQTRGSMLFSFYVQYPSLIMYLFTI